MKRILPTALISLLALSGCSGTMPKLGHENGLLAACPTSPNCVSSKAKDSKHFIEPLQVTGTPTEVKDALLKALNERNPTSVTAAKEGYIRAEFASKLFGFVDDIEFYIPMQESPEVSVQVRSAARVGYSDFGVNRKRIELIREKLKALSGES